MKSVVKFVLLFVIIAAILLFTLPKENTRSLAELYDLDENNQIERVLLLRYSEVNLLDPEWEPAMPEPQIEIKVEQIIPFYDYLRQVEVTKVKSVMSIEVEKLPTYNISFGFKDSNTKSNFGIELGEHYILVSNKGELSGMFKHNLTDKKYIELVNILEECIE